jgi:hypothetical protein
MNFLYKVATAAVRTSLGISSSSGFDGTPVAGGAGTSSRTSLGNSSSVGFDGSPGAGTSSSFGDSNSSDNPTTPKTTPKDTASDGPQVLGGFGSGKTPYWTKPNGKDPVANHRKRTAGNTSHNHDCRATKRIANSLFATTNKVKRNLMFHVDDPSGDATSSAGNRDALKLHRDLCAEIAAVAHQQHVPLPCATLDTNSTVRGGTVSTLDGLSTAERVGYVKEYYTTVTDYGTYKRVLQLDQQTILTS